MFAYGDGVAYVADTSISTAESTSGGIHAAGGGTLYAWDLDVSTQGESSAAIRSDRGGGTMVVDGGTYTSNGSGSPAVYSTADITVHNATLIATGSGAICIEGQNSIRLYDCDLSGNMADLEQNGPDLERDPLPVYVRRQRGGQFHLCDVRRQSDCGKRRQEGNVIWDSISTLDLYLTEGSVLTGAVIDDESDAGSGGEDYAALYIDASSTWVVTGDSVVARLYYGGTIVDADGKTVSIVGEDGNVYVSGDSAYTVTVGTYSQTVDLSGAGAPESWKDYQVTKPEEL